MTDLKPAEKLTDKILNHVLTHTFQTDDDFRSIVLSMIMTSNVLTAAFEAGRAEGLEEAADKIPTTWLDPIFEEFGVKSLSPQAEAMLVAIKSRIFGLQQPREEGK